MSELFNTLLYTPFFNLLVFLYNTAAFNDFGIAIILLTLIIRFILSPLSIKTFKSQKALNQLQPRIKEIQEKFKNEPQKQSQVIMELYKQHKVNPFSGCLPLLIQLPILIALYKVSIAGFNADSFSALYSFVKAPDYLNSISLGFFDLTKKNILLSLIAGGTQFFQAKFSSLSQSSPDSGKNSNSNPLGAMNKQMLYFFPLITIMVSMSFPAGLPLYWIATTVFSIFEQAYINRIKNEQPNRKFDPSDR